MSGLTERERRVLDATDAIGVLDPGGQESGRKIADSMREQFPGIADIDLGRATAYITGMLAQLCAEPEIHEMTAKRLMQSVATTLGFAACELTRLEREAS